MPEVLEAPEVQAAVSDNTEWTLRTETVPPEPQIQSSSPQEAPKAETPAVPSPEPPAPKEPQAQLAPDYLKEFGVENKEQLAKAVESHKLLSDPFLRNLVEYARQDGADLPFYLQVQKVDVNSFGNNFKEPVILKLMFENGLTREKAELLITDLYKQDEDTFSEKEREIGAINLELEGRKAVQWLKNFQEQNKMTDPERQRISSQQSLEQAETARVKTWESNIDAVLTEASKLNINLTSTENGKDINIPYELDITNTLTNSKQEVTKALMSALGDYQISYDSKEGKEFAKGFISSWMFNQNRDKFISQIITWRDAQKEVEFAKRSHNTDYRTTGADHSAVDPQNTDWKLRN